MGMMMANRLNIEEFRGYLIIDKVNLDEDLTRQSSLFFEVGEAYTEACSDRDGAKDDLNTLSGRLYKIYRKKLEAKTDGRITEEAVRSIILDDDEHIQATTQLLAAQRDAMLLEHLKDAFRQRSFMLRDLAQLAIANFFERDVVRSMDDAARSVKFGRSKKAIAEDRKKGRDGTKSRRRTRVE